MRKLIAVFCGAAVFGLTGQALAQTTAPSTTPTTATPSTTMKEDKVTQREVRMKGMDANNDGMVSEAEFNNYHKGLWGKIKRNAAGLAMYSDVESMYGPGTVPSAIPGQPREKAKP